MCKWLRRLWRRIVEMAKRLKSKGPDQLPGPPAKPDVEKAAKELLAATTKTTDAELVYDEPPPQELAHRVSLKPDGSAEVRLKDGKSITLTKNMVEGIALRSKIK